MQAVSEHAKAGGWYSDLVPESQDAIKFKCPLEVAREDIVLELAGMHGLWLDLSELVTWPGISVVLTGDAC